MLTVCEGGGGGREGSILTCPHAPSRPLQLRNLITDVSQHKLLVFAGPCVEETGELMLQTGCFSLRDFIQIFTDKEVRGRAVGGHCLLTSAASRPSERSCLCRGRIPPSAAQGWRGGWLHSDPPVKETGGHTERWE